MGVAVYPRLGALLRARNLTVAELQQRIAVRYGLAVEPRSLDAWARELPIKRADLEVAGAVAAILDVGLAELFEVDLAPILPPEEAILDPARADRLSQLLDEQQSRELSAAEQDELDTLITDYSRRVQEQGLPEIAARRGISVEQARREVHAELDEAIRWWGKFQEDPERRRAAVADLKRRRRRATPR